MHTVSELASPLTIAVRATRTGRRVVIAGWIVVTLALTSWLALTPPHALRDVLRRSQFWTLELQLVVLLFLTWATLPAFIRSLALNSRDVLRVLSSAALAFSLAGFVAPQTNRIFYDEQIYQNAAQNLADLHLAQMCNDGNVEYGSLVCLRGEYDKHPYAYPHLLSAMYRFTGAREWVAFRLNTLVAAGTAAVVFLITAALVGAGPAAGYAALIAALIPEQIRWSHSGAVEPIAALTCAFAVLTSLALVRLRTTVSLLWMVAATAYAMQFRPESALVACAVLVVLVCYARDELTTVRFWGAALAGVALLAVHIGHSVSIGNDPWNSDGTRLSLAFLPEHLRTNGLFYLADARFPAFYTGLAIFGLVTARQVRAAAVPLVYFLLFWGVFLVFFAGSYNFGVNSRFSLMTYPPLAILAGMGAAAIVERARRVHWPPLARPRTAPLAMLAVIAIQFSWYIPFVRSLGEEAWGARADVAFAREMAGGLPPNSIVLTHNPNMFHMWGQSAAQLSLATTEPDYVRNDLTARYTGGVFIHWNFWCNVHDELQNSFCTRALDMLPHRLVGEHRERTYRYAIYRVDLPVEP